MNTSGDNGLSRRTLLGITAGAAATTLATAGTASAAVPAAGSRRAADPKATDLTAGQAWRKLVRGNDRFVDGRQKHPHESLEWRESLVEGQHPFAVVLGCADSRVTPELVFDEGLGDLFVIRSAGEVLDTAVIGSIEYAVEHLSVPLIVVLGHESCGAVSATVDVVRNGTEVNGDISTLVRAIEPAVRATPADSDADAYLAACVAEQARRSGQYLQERSSIIRDAVAHDGVTVVAATYELAGGKVARL
ncbi:carbonic anhydrase [Prauserella cavernicola]|uniref:Carbonic anhydrase n=1 Tax=Prauserella cavernicola TaxID=2800127 RepID=A0A934QWN9_9PSEU|nr:carbonic anhydrase [Prauserella cavernicola]MBK1787801.1 carbonic anhydrase [Prauserella cavernicola]